MSLPHCPAARRIRPRARRWEVRAISGGELRCVSWFPLHERLGEELMARAYSERGIQVQHDRFLIEGIEARRIAASGVLQRRRVLVFARPALALVVYSHQEKVHTTSAESNTRLEHSAWCSGPLVAIAGFSGRDRAIRRGGSTTSRFGLKKERAS